MIQSRDLELHGQFVDDFHAHSERYAVLYLDADPVSSPLLSAPDTMRLATGALYRTREEEYIIHQHQGQEYKNTSRAWEEFRAAGKRHEDHDTKTGNQGKAPGQVKISDICFYKLWHTVLPGYFNGFENGIDDEFVFGNAFHFFLG